MARSLLTIVAFAALGLAAASQKENALRGRDGLNEAIRMANANAVAEPAVGEELDSTTTTGTGGGGTGGSSTTTTGGGGTTTGGGGGGTTTSGGGGGPTGADVYATFFADESCTKPAFALNVSGCEDLSPQVSNICADLSIPALLCPYVSVRATCSNGYVKGTVYFSEIKTNGGGTCGTNANKISIPVLPENKCYSIGLDGFGIGFEGVCN